MVVGLEDDERVGVDETTVFMPRTLSIRRIESACSLVLPRISRVLIVYLSVPSPRSRSIGGWPPGRRARSASLILPLPSLSLRQ